MAVVAGVVAAVGQHDYRDDDKREPSGLLGTLNCVVSDGRVIAERQQWPARTTGTVNPVELSGAAANLRADHLELASPLSDTLLCT